MFNKISGSIKTTKFSYKLYETNFNLINCATESIFFSVFLCVEPVDLRKLCATE